MVETTITTTGYRISYVEEGEELGHAYVYLLKNDLHGEPYALLEDVFVEREHRGRGIGGWLHEQVLQKARASGCYKLIATSRDDGTRDMVHAWYEGLGYRKYGLEFRMDLT